MTFMGIPKIVSCIVVMVGLYLGHISTSGTKTQTVRIVDVVLIGPLMIYFGHHATRPSLFSILLTFFGATTITYNLKNYIHASK
jgi:uncharacterized membrane protein